MMKHIFEICFVSFNFFMMGTMESSLYTILPRYIAEYYGNTTENKSSLSVHNSTGNCYIQSPHYVIVSLVFLSKNLAMLFTNPFYGYLVERFNIYLITIVTQCFGILTALLYAFGYSLFLFILGRIVDAFVSGGLFVAIFVIISKYFNNFNVRGRYYGLCNTMFFMSISLGPIYGAKLDETSGKFLVFVLMIPMWGICILSTLLLYYCVGRNKEKEQNIGGLCIELTCSDKSIEKEVPCDQNSSPQFVGKEVLLLPLKGSSYEMKTENCEPSEPDSVMKGIHINDNLSKKESSNEIQSTSGFRIIFNMIIDKYVAACFVELYISNFSMFSLPATLPSWMAFSLCSSEVQQGLVWTFGFVGYLAGVLAVVLISRFVPSLKIFSPMIAKIIVGILLIYLPFSKDWKLVFIPIIGMHLALGVVEQVIFPMTTHLADVRHNKNYEAMSALTAQSLTFCGVSSTLVSGQIAQSFGFGTLSIAIGVVNLISSPLSLIHHRKNFK